MLCTTCYVVHVMWYSCCNYRPNSVLSIPYPQTPPLVWYNKCSRLLLPSMCVQRPISVNTYIIPTSMCSIHTVWPSSSCFPQCHVHLHHLPGSNILIPTCTCTDWDLEVCLNYECRRKQIRKPTYFNQWIDVRATYKVHYITCMCTVWCISNPTP